MKNYDVIILGGGASSLMCAGNLGRKLKVAIVEHNGEIAKKMKISGGGKCNITNVNCNTTICMQFAWLYDVINNN